MESGMFSWIRVSRGQVASLDLCGQAFCTTTPQSVIIKVWQTCGPTSHKSDGKQDANLQSGARRWPLSWTGVKPQESGAQVPGSRGGRGDREPSLGSLVLRFFLPSGDFSFHCPSGLGALWVTVHLVLGNGSENTLGLFHQVVVVGILNQNPFNWRAERDLSLDPRHGARSSLWAFCAESFPLVHVPFLPPLCSQKMQ